MARGDVIAGLVGVAGESIVAVQPASGEEWMIEITSPCGDGTNAGFGDIYDGVNSGASFAANTIDPPRMSRFVVLLSTASVEQRFLLYFTNSVYFRLQNHAPATRYLSYHGVKTK